MRSFIVVLSLLVATPAFAAKSKKPEAPAPKDETKEPEHDDKPEPKHVDPRETNKPSPYGSGYASFGTRGGATLGGGGGLRVNAFGGTHSFGDGFGNGGLEAFYFFGGAKNFDFGLGIRLPGFPLGAAPALEMRGRIANHKGFHLALTLHANAPFTFTGMFAGQSFGAHVEVGMLASYFFTDNIEFIFGPTVQGTLLMIAYSIPVFQLGISGRLGLVYTLKKHDVGLMQITDIAPGWYAPYGRPRATTSLATQRAEPYFRVAVNFLLGVQVKL
ncbi:MAG: hypothetical protein IT381_18625 [Deltaproteobacteria bacterium]|nr:hypothetical protein [Deltaproteobacteria bacterium]